MRFPKIKEIRRQSHLTQKQIAEVLNTTQRQYSRWEIGEYEFPLSKMIQMAKYYNVSLDYLCDLSSEATPLEEK